MGRRLRLCRLQGCTDPARDRCRTLMWTRRANRLVSMSGQRSPRFGVVLAHRIVSLILMIVFICSIAMCVLGSLICGAVLFRVAIRVARSGCVLEIDTIESTGRIVYSASGLLMRSLAVALAHRRLRLISSVRGLIVSVVRLVGDGESGEGVIARAESSGVAAACSRESTQAEEGCLYVVGGVSVAPGVY